MATEDRLRTVALQNYCDNCLAHSHVSRECTSSQTCQQCNKRHHTMLHIFAVDHPVHEARSTHQPRENSQSTGAHHTLTPTLPRVATLRPTAVITVAVGRNRYHARAIIDGCAAQTLITEKLVRLWQLPTLPLLEGDACVLQIRASYELSFTLDVYAQIVTKIDTESPSNPVDERIRKKFTNVALADPEFFRSRPIELLLGLDVVPKIMLDGLMPGGAGFPMAQNSIFGYILSGCCSI